MTESTNVDEGLTSLADVVEILELARVGFEGETEVGLILQAIEQDKLVWTSDLMGVQELAELFGVGRSTVSSWGSQTWSPKPVAVISSNPIYNGWAFLRAWNRWTPVKGRKAGTPAPSLLEQL